MSTRPRTWARHYQDDWQSRAGDPRLPKWLRVAALAFGSHSDNGHARFKRGEIALILGSLDPDTGEVHPYANVRRAISEAVEYGWLHEGSYWGCLIVPAHSIRKGELGKTPTPCPLQPRHKERGNRSLSERFMSPTPTLSERFKPRSAHSANGSEHKPLLSVLSPPDHDDTCADGATA